MAVDDSPKKFWKFIRDNIKSGNIRKYHLLVNPKKIEYPGAWVFSGAIKSETIRAQAPANYKIIFVK
jgi:hypothetical protein